MLNHKISSAILAVVIGVLLLTVSTSAATYTVDNTTDNGALTACTAAANDCSLRGAFATANGTAVDDTINFDPVVFALAQTITLTRGANTELNVFSGGGTLTINGTGANLLTIFGDGINSFLNTNSVFIVNQGASAAISNLTVTGGTGKDFGGSLGTIGGGIINSGNLTLNYVTVRDNYATSAGGGIYNNGVLTLNNSTVSGNATKSTFRVIETGVISKGGLGGGICNCQLTTATTTITNSTISDNLTSTGGGIYDDFGTVSLTSSTISKNTARGNEDNKNGGGIYTGGIGGVFILNTIIADNSGLDAEGRLTSLGYNLISGTNGVIIQGTTTGNILNQNAQLAPLGNYGGQTMTHALLPNSPAINAGTSDGTPATDQRGSARVGNTDIGAFEANANFVAMLPDGKVNQSYSQTLVPKTGSTTYCLISGSLPPGFTGTFNCFVANTALILAGTPTQSGTFTFAIEASNASGFTTTNYTLNIVGLTTATTTTITSDNPDPSVVGQPVTVTYTVTASSGTPTGNVIVSDGTNSCTGTVAAGQCSVVLTNVGARTLTATYAGDSNYNGSVSADAPHTVNRADTTATITAQSANPTAPGQSFTVFYSVAVNSPGAGTPTGSVFISDGTADGCNASIAAGQCSLSLTTVGNRTLTATYIGDGNFNGSVSAGANHKVTGNTTTTITAQSVNPTVVGQSFTVSYNVAVVAPGAGTPTGNVTVSDGEDSCTGTAAAGGCSLAITTVGNRTLTATYAGDTNFNTSTSAGVVHTVNKANTTTAITAQSANPTTAGQSFTVSFSVTVASPGAGTPSGSVTVSDGVNSCTAVTVAGQCSLALTTVGSRTLTATYIGNVDFNSSVSAGAAHTVTAAGPLNLVVDNIGDDGNLTACTAAANDCSLRGAVAAANAASTDDAITFDPAVFASVQTITLTGGADGELTITSGTLTINGTGTNLLTISGNNQSSIFFVLDGATVAISNLTLTGGRGKNFGGSLGVIGGGIINSGNLMLDNVAVSGNSAATQGGGIYNNGSLTLNGSTVSGNSATGNGGGGICNCQRNSATLTLTNSTISGNSATGNGGGILNDIGTLNLTNATVSGNSANGNGGGIYNNIGNVNARNTIIAGNTASSIPDFSGILASQGYNLIGNTSGTTITGTTTGNILNQNAQLAPLGNNGGATRTHQLLAGSPAIDQGSAVAGITTDQRGFMRPVDSPAIANAAGGDGSDIGAFEVLAPTAASVSVSGRVIVPNNRGLRNARMILTDGRGTARMVITTAFGYFRFTDVEAGATYVLTVQSKSYEFEPQVLNVSGDLTELIFNAVSQNPFGKKVK